MNDEPLPEHTRPAGASDATVEAVGKVSEAFEVIEEARGMLYGFHRHMGMADLALGEAVQMLRDAGHIELADRIDRELVGRNVVQGRWTFQLVEEFDDTYYACFQGFDREAAGLLGGRRHVFEAEMKEKERTRGEPHHEVVPHDGGPQSD